MTEVEPSESSGASSERPPPRPGERDLDLDALPPPRHPWRRLTLFTLVLTLVASLSLLASLRGELAFSLVTRSPRALGELARISPGEVGANSWVQGEGELATDGAIAYRRPLERDSYRLARVTGTDKIWVELRVPRDDDDPNHKRFVSPTSFVGRLVPVSQGGLRLSNLSSAIADAGRPSLPADAWLLVDGEAPATTRWTLGLCALLLGFAGFNLFGLLRLLRPVA